MQKTKILNDYFSSVFTTEDVNDSAPLSIPEKCPSVNVSKKSNEGAYPMTGSVQILPLFTKAGENLKTTDQ